MHLDGFLFSETWDNAMLRAEEIYPILKQQKTTTKNNNQVCMQATINLEVFKYEGKAKNTREVLLMKINHLLWFVEFGRY